LPGGVDPDPGQAYYRRKLAQNQPLDPATAARRSSCQPIAAQP
jgi:hypothetical protein